MANLGSVPALIADANAKVTTNGNGENTGARVNELVRNILDTLTAAPVVGGATPAAVFASAIQGALANTAVQPGANVSSLVNDAGYLTTVPPPVPSPVLTGNMAYVDAVNGDDGTGEVGDFTLPFLTLLAAQTAAPSGTTILVYPGSYTSAGLGKDGVNWFFMPGATVNFDSNDGFIGGNTTYKVRGHANIIANAFLGRAVYAANSSCDVDIECDSITSVRLYFGLGVARVKARVITFTGASGGIAAFGGTATVEGDITSSVVNRLLDHTGGCTLRIKNSKMTITTAAAPALQLTSGAWVSLENVSISSDGDSIASGAASTVNCQNVIADQAVGANVTVIGNMQISVGAAGAAEVATAAADGTWSWV